MISTVTFASGLCTFGINIFYSYFLKEGKDMRMFYQLHVILPQNSYYTHCH